MLIKPRPLVANLFLSTIIPEPWALSWSSVCTMGLTWSLEVLFSDKEIEMEVVGLGVCRFMF
jgi:hypothetical protein